MVILVGIVLVLILFSGLDKALWASSYEEQRESTHDRRTTSRGRGRARASRRNNPARGWSR
ncbi:MAG: hypothetical protein GXY68_08675 [Chloroflexi bacterium]|jgi:hypothetical protein|nr:hypothetical protein [Chloroflexota bacterium]